MESSGYDRRLARDVRVAEIRETGRPLWLGDHASLAAAKAIARRLRVYYPDLNFTCRPASGGYYSIYGVLRRSDGKGKL